VEQAVTELRHQMSFHDLLRGARCGLLPAPAAKRQIYRLDELLERINRLRALGYAAVDGPQDVGQDRFRFPLWHLRATPQHLAPPTAVLPPAGYPHAMEAMLPDLQASFLKSLSTHSFASFLRQKR